MSIDHYDQKPAPSVLTRGWYTLRGSCRIAYWASGRTFLLLFKLAVLLYFIFCILVLGLRYVVLPNIDAYKPQVESMATRAIGNAVSIGSLQASWSGLRPQLLLDTVVIHDMAGNPALTLPQVAATFSWWTLAVADLRLDSLEISRPDMEIERDVEGRLYVAGIFIDTGRDGDGRGADWILSQREIVIRDGRVRWNDRLRGAPELLLEDVDFLLHNRWRHHRVALNAKPPSAFSAPIDIRAAFEHPRFTRNISDASRWRGEIYLDLSDTDLTVWRDYVDYPVDMQSGTGSVRAWLSFDNSKVADFTADLSLKNLAARLRPDLEPLNLLEVAGRISIREDFDAESEDGTPTFGVNGHAISLANFTLRSEDGLYLPPTTISESYVPAKDGRQARTEIRARTVDLETLTDFAARLPLPAEQRRLLADFSPRGVVSNFLAQWEGEYPNLSAYSVNGRFAGLSLKAQPAHPARPKTTSAPAQAAVPAIPGFENLTGSVEASERGGVLMLDSKAPSLQLPGYLAQSAMPFEHLNLNANWSFKGDNELLLDVHKMEFAREGVAGSLSGTHLMRIDKKPGESPGTVDINGRLTRVDLKAIGPYLPLQTPSYLRDWLDGALMGGTARDVKIRLRGDLAEFPFRSTPGNAKAKGEFSVSGRIEDGRLNYVPGSYGPDGKSPRWPVIDQINGNIIVEQTRMDITADSARSSGTALTRVKAVVPDLLADDLLLTVDGEAAGPLQDFVRFTRNSPVGEWVGNITEPVKASGNSRLSLKLHLPLYRLEQTTVRGTLQFAGNSVSLLEGMPTLAGTSGSLEFREDGFSIPAIRSTFLGGPVTISGGTLRDGSTQIRAEGLISAAGIRQAYSMPVNSEAADRIRGGSRYNTTIRIRDGRPEIVVESNLVGIALDFPEPLRKASAASMPLRFELATLPSDSSLTLRDRIRLTLGTAINAQYKREKGIVSDARWRVISGGIGVNVPAPEPDSGVYANVDIPALDIDAWRRAVTSVLATPDAGQPTTNNKAQISVQQSASNVAQNDALSIAQYIEPEVLAAHAAELTVMDRKLINVVVGASQQNGAWRANIDSEQASGYVTWTEARSGRGLGRVTARLASLIIPKSAATEVTDLLEGKNDTEQLPAVDIVAENFELFGKRFGQLELIADNARGLSGREWRISKLALTNPEGQLKATGKWASRGEESQSSLDYTLDITDAGRLLDRFGFSNVLRGGKGRMRGDISWDGPPFSLDIPSLSGKIQMDVAAGQFLKVDGAAQGAAKLLGVLSLQSLPRRLTLDFRDVFSEGFSFDGVTAAANIKQGVATTENFKMRGVSATVLIDGKADIAKENQDLHVVVIPEINAGAASVVYGLAVNPVIGVGTFLAQLFLREPLMRAFTFEYQITGDWKDPVVTKLPRKQNSNSSSEAVNKLEPNG